MPSFRRRTSQPVAFVSETTIGPFSNTRNKLSATEDQPPPTAYFPDGHIAVTDVVAPVATDVEVPATWYPERPPAEPAGPAGPTSPRRPWGPAGPASP